MPNQPGDVIHRYDIGVQKEVLLTANDVARTFNVCNKTVVRWMKAGKLPVIRTPTGRVRFRPSDVNRLMDVVRYKR